MKFILSESRSRQAIAEDKEGHKALKDKNICDQGVEKGDSRKLETSQTNTQHWKKARS